jgi:hypothetical protein
VPELGHEVRRCELPATTNCACIFKASTAPLSLKTGRAFGWPLRWKEVSAALVDDAIDQSRHEARICEPWHLATGTRIQLHHIAGAKDQTITV